ncbi:MAG: hypothetical protein ACHQ7M_15605 [Chloroflexota bacterium]
MVVGPVWAALLALAAGLAESAPLELAPLAAGLAEALAAVLVVAGTLAGAVDAALPPPPQAANTALKASVRISGRTLMETMDNVSPLKPSLGAAQWCVPLLTMPH